MKPLLQRCLVLFGLVLALPALGGESSWTAKPILQSSRLPLAVVLTGDPNILYSDSFRFVLRSEDGGRNWSQLEVPPGTDLKVDPFDANRLFRRCYSNLMRSTDGGKIWVPALQLTGETDSFALLISRHFPGRVYVTTALAIWQSRDGGLTFTKISDLPGVATGNSVVLSEAADGGLYLRRFHSCRFCSYRWRVDRSQDQGKTWETLDSGNSWSNAIEQVVPHPNRPEAVYFVRNASPANRLLSSTDRGSTRVDQGPLPTHGYLETDSTRPDSLFLAGLRQLWRSGDGGNSWIALNLPPSPDGIYPDLIFSGQGRILFYVSHLNPSPENGIEAFLSEDAGNTWTPLAVEGGKYPDSILDAAIAGAEGTLYARSRGGHLYHSTDGGTTWTPRATTSEIYGLLTGDPLDGDTVYAAGRVGNDSGVVRSRDGGRTFENVATVYFLVDLVAFRRGAATTLIATLQNGSLARSPDGGDTWVVGPPQGIGFPGSPVFQTLAVSGTSVFTTDGQHVYGSEDGGATWSRRSSGAYPPVAGGGVVAYLNALTNTVDVSTDGAATFTSQPLPFPAYQNYYQSAKLEADPHGQLYFLASGVLLRSRDRGQTWQALTQSLPDLAYDPKLLFDPADPARLYWAEQGGFHTGRFADTGALALLRGRFEAHLRWRTAATSAWTPGEAISTSDQTGVFRLFTPERAEVAIQMLDGRSQGGRFWAFVASMTDVELEVEIEDRLTGQVWRHHQELGEIRSFADLSAFPLEAEPGSGNQTLPFGGIFAPQSVVTLNQNFDVSVSWIANGEINVAQGRKLLGDTAAFTFFDPGAVDVLINILDGRPLNGNFWLFGGSLTDTEFIVTIKNRTTGATKVYRNPPGAFAGFSDTTGL